ncbi:MAG: hypothetical protein ACLP19_26100 [Xanthobacteraceae bacterium]
MPNKSACPQSQSQLERIDYLDGAAQRRHITTERLVDRLIDRIVEDRLVDAILDDELKQ